MTVTAEGIKPVELPFSSTQALANGYNDDGCPSVHPFLQAVGSIIFSCVLHNSADISVLNRKTKEMNPLYYRIMFSACFECMAKCGPVLGLWLVGLILLSPETLSVDSPRNSVV